MQLFPAIDLFEGKVVRLKQGRYDEVTVYDDDPVARARAFAGHAERLHVVDLEGARAGHCVQRDLISRIVEAFGPGVQVGGGVRDVDAFESYRELGADRVVLGTAAIRSPNVVRACAKRHPGRVVVALDAKSGRVATDGWEQLSDATAADVAGALADLPIGAILYTDVARDGTEVGPAIEATAELARSSGLPVLASGGVGELSHLHALARCRDIAGVIVGRALYEKRFTIEEAQKALAG